MGRAVALLDRLCRQADAPEHQCRFAWTKDAVAIWDNRAVQHYASSDYWPQRRSMERASVIGTAPRASQIRASSPSGRTTLLAEPPFLTARDLIVSCSVPRAFRKRSMSLLLLPACALALAGLVEQPDLEFVLDHLHDLAPSTTSTSASASTTSSHDPDVGHAGPPSVDGHRVLLPVEEHQLRNRQQPRLERHHQHALPHALAAEVGDPDDGQHAQRVHRARIASPTRE